jgi:hypothetical protein
MTADIVKRTMAFVGFCASCGGARMAVCGDPQYRGDIGSDVRDAIKRGLVIAYVDYTARPIVMGCLPDCSERLREADQLKKWAAVIAPVSPSPSSGGG